jgi:hypothetical protein
MEDTEGGENTNPPITAPRQTRWSRLVGYVKRKLHERKTKKENESPTDRAARRTAHATVWIAAFTVVMALVGAGTLYEIIEGGRDTHALAVAAGKQADRMQVFADRMKDQTDRTKDLADRMKDQADRTKTIAEQAVIQAKAAKSAADTAKTTLHISERAYLMFGAPTDDFPHKRTNIPIINSGRIPSGTAKVVIHEATFKVDDPSAKAIPLENVTETHWTENTYQTIPVVPLGSLLSAEVHFPSMVEDDVKNGRQGLLIIAVVTYNDGFPNTPEQSFMLCDSSSYQTAIKLFSMRPCNDPFGALATLITLDGYPDPKHQEK